jgi:RNA polymerase sigma factor (sigma-70 family)
MTISYAANEPSDAVAIGRSVADPDAFVAVFERHFSLIHRYLRVRVGDSDADDLAAQTFEIAFRRRAAYDGSREDARPWLFGIAARLVSEHRRRQRRATAGLRRLFFHNQKRGDADERPSDDGAPDLRAALASVREEDRDLLFLYACVELSYEECAAALALPLGTVRSRLHRARERLRRELELELSLRMEAPR